MVDFNEGGVLEAQAKRDITLWLRKLLVNGFIGIVSFTVERGGGELYLRNDGTFWGGYGSSNPEQIIGLTKCPDLSCYTFTNCYSVRERLEQLDPENLNLSKL